MRPRPVPGRLAPFIAGAAVILLALPIFFVADWKLKGWILGATIWAASHVLALVVARVRSSTGNLAGSGVLAFGMMFRAVAVLVVLVAVAAADPHVALAGALLYALAYTLELGISLLTYFGGPAR
jgi:hypothetical protein